MPEIIGKSVGGPLQPPPLPRPKPDGVHVTMMTPVVVTSTITDKITNATEGTVTILILGLGSDEVVYQYHAPTKTWMEQG